MATKSKPELQSELLTVAEVSQILNVSRRLIEYKIVAKEIPGHCLLWGKPRFRRTVIEAWIEAGTPDDFPQGAADDARGRR